MNGVQPAITVIMALYKGEATMCRMVECVLSQTFQDFELILVDDGSPDRCGEIADEYAKNDVRVRVLHKPNGGLSDARNKALEIAKGEYTIHFDHDDWVELNCLEEMYAKAKETDADMVICDYFHNDKYRQTYTRQEPSALDHWAVLKDVLTGKLYGYCWNKLIKLSVYKDYAVKFPLFYGCEDQYGMCQILKHDIKIAYLPNAYCHYVFRQGSLSRLYDDKTYDNDVLARDMFTSLLSDTPYGNLAYERKSAAIFSRAFMYGQSQYSSAEFKEKFSQYRPYVRARGIMGLLYAMSCNGYYVPARRIFQLCFDVKQTIKMVF